MTLTQAIYYALGAVGLFLFLSLVVIVLTWAERKALARIQMRMGPMRVGLHGALQPLADSIKLFTKEDILPSWADRRVYWFAPIAVFIPALMLWLTLPVARDLVLRNLEMGLFLHHGHLGAVCDGACDGGLGIGEQVRDAGRAEGGGAVG